METGNEALRRNEFDSKVAFPSYFPYTKPPPDFYAPRGRPPPHSGFECRGKGNHLMCVVCGDTSSGKHYGVLACNGCSGFFKRSVRRKLVYRCQAASGYCLVDKAHRNQCQACRLRKCLECGMNRDAVQNERQPRSTATVRPQSAFETPPSDHDTCRGGLKDVTVAAFPTLFGVHQRLVTPVFTEIKPPKICPTQATKSERNTSESSTVDETLQNETCCPYSSEIFSIDNRGGLLFREHKEALYDSSARILLLCIRWARNLPSYTCLPMQDQVTLLEETWSELFLLCCMQWSMSLETSPWFSAMETASSMPTAQYQKHLLCLERAFARSKLLGIDFAEFACLKAIILFRCDIASLKDVHQVEIFQDHAQLMLAHHIKSQHFDYTFRFGRLLLLLPTLREIPPETVESIFFRKTLGAKPLEKMLSDLFKC